MSVSSDQATPVSVSSVRSSFTDETSVGLERQIKLLLIHRLASEPRVFVLDRERLRALSQEKAFDPTLDEKFWTSGYVLDVVVNPKGVVKKKTTLEVHAARPGSEAITYSSTRPTAELRIS